MISKARMHQIPAGFTILIDTREQLPFGFEGIRADSTEWPTATRRAVDSGKLQPDQICFEIPAEFKCLGDSRGDYSIAGMEGLVHIERKAMNDAHSTILSYGNRRELFERELAFLAQCECSAVVLECSFDELLAEVPSYGKRSIEANRKQLFRQLQAWQIDFRVPWFFYSNRQMAEVGTFRILQRYWKKKQAEARAMARATKGCRAFKSGKSSLDLQTVSVLESL